MSLTFSIKLQAPEDLTPVIEYFEKTYVNGIPGRGRRRAVAPQYLPALRNLYEMCLTDGQKTNNLNEG